MALINCNECGNQISDKAQSCPKCGAPNTNDNTPPCNVQTEATNANAPLQFAFNPCGWHSKSPAVSSCVTCGIALCKECANSAPLKPDNKPQCRTCSLQMLKKNIATNQRKKWGAIVKFIFAGVFLVFSLCIYLSSDNSFATKFAWFIAGLGSLPFVYISYITRSRTKEEKMADAMYERFKGSCLEGIAVFIFLTIVAFLLAPVLIVVYVLSSIVIFASCRSAIKQDKKLCAQIQEDIKADPQV